MTHLRRHVEDRNGITKQVPPDVQRRTQRGRSRTAGEDDMDERQESKNQGHGHPREERRSEGNEP